MGCDTTVAKRLIDSTARRLNITNQKVTQLAAKGAGAGGGKAKK